MHVLKYNIIEYLYSTPSKYLLYSDVHSALAYMMLNVITNE